MIELIDPLLQKQTILIMLNFILNHSFLKRSETDRHWIWIIVKIVVLHLPLATNKFLEFLYLNYKLPLFLLLFGKITCFPRNLIKINKETIYVFFWNIYIFQSFKVIKLKNHCGGAFFTLAIPFKVVDNFSSKVCFIP